MEKIVVDGKLDANFKFEIARRPGGENIKKCFACGTCTAGCPVFHVEHEYNPRKIIRMILLGLRKEVLSSKIIWFCSQCYTCSANCPQDVDFSDIMFSLRDLAVQEGYAPPDLLEKIEQIGTRAHEFRRDCISILLGMEGVSHDQVRENVNSTLQQIKQGG